MSVDPELAERLIEVYRDLQTLARVERRRVARLQVDTDEPLAIVEELEQDVHDLAGLAEIALRLAPAAAEGARPRRRVRR